MLTSIIAAVVILGILVLVHEAGHFLVAKRCGVRVLRFSIGYPPKLIGFRRGQTEYAIGATPFGGYVRMLGDEIGDDSGQLDVEGYLVEVGRDLVEATGLVSAHRLAGPKEELWPSLMTLARGLETKAGEIQPQATVAGRALRPEERLLLEEILRQGSVERALEELCKAPPPAVRQRFNAAAFPTQDLRKRFFIVLAGPLANILFAPVLLSFLFMYGVPRLLPVVGEVKPGLPAAMAGLRSGDRILAIDGRVLKNWEELSDTIKRSNGAALKLEYERKQASVEQHATLTLIPRRETEKSVFGESSPQWVIGILPRGDTVTQSYNPLRAISEAVLESGRMTGMLVVGIAKIFAGSTPLRQALGGPIMIAQMAGHEAREGLANFVMFMVMLSIELGIINLIPVPMLDGGHLLFFAVEGVRGKPLQVRHREIAQQVGLFLLMALMAFVIFNDISRIVQG